MRCSPLLGSVGSWPVCCHRDIIVTHSPFLWWSSERLMKADVTAGSGWIQPETCGKQEERWERKGDLFEGFLSAGLPRQQVYVWQEECLGPKTCWLAKFQPAPAQESGHISGGSRRQQFHQGCFTLKPECQRPADNTRCPCPCPCPPHPDCCCPPIVMILHPTLV